MVIDRYQLGIRVSFCFLGGVGGGKEWELQWVDPSAFTKNTQCIKLTTTIISFRIRKTSIKNNWIKLEGWSRDGRAKKYTNKICGDSHIHYTSLRLLFSHLWMLTSDNMIREGGLLISWLLYDWSVYSCAPYIATQKASVGMYSGCDYPHKSCLCTFWPCHPYFILPILFNCFCTCYCSFFNALWAKPWIGIFQKYHLDIWHDFPIQFSTSLWIIKN